MRATVLSTSSVTFSLIIATSSRRGDICVFMLDSSVSMRLVMSLNEETRFSSASIRAPMRASIRSSIELCEWVIASGTKSLMEPVISSSRAIFSSKVSWRRSTRSLTVLALVVELSSSLPTRVFNCSSMLPCTRSMRSLTAVATDSRLFVLSAGMRSLSSSMRPERGESWLFTSFSNRVMRSRTAAMDSCPFSMGSRRVTTFFSTLADDL